MLFSSDEDECERMPCKNDGTCVNTVGSFRCRCLMEWTGPNCDKGIILVNINFNVSKIVNFRENETEFR